MLNRKINKYASREHLCTKKIPNLHVCDINKKRDNLGLEKNEHFGIFFNISPSNHFYRYPQHIYNLKRTDDLFSYSLSGWGGVGVLFFVVIFMSLYEYGDVHVMLNVCFNFIIYSNIMGLTG